MEQVADRIQKPGKEKAEENGYWNRGSNTWEIKHAQELTHALKRREWMLGYHLWQICGLCGNRRSRQRSGLGSLASY